MNRDAFIGAVYAGAMASIVSIIAQVATIKMGLHNTSILEVAAGVFLPLEQIASPIGVAFGFIGHMIIGATWGIVFYVLSLLFGVKNGIHRGLLLGMFSWFFGTEMMRWNATNFPVYGINEQVGKLIHDIIFGASLGYLVPTMAMRDAPERRSILGGMLGYKLAQPALKPEEPAYAEIEKGDTETSMETQMERSKLEK